MGQHMSWASVLGAFRPIGSHSSGATITSAVTLTPATGATKLLMQANTQNVRFTLDGSVPTTSAGFVLKAGDAPTIINIEKGMTIKVIEATATSDLEYQWGN